MARRGENIYKRKDGRWEARILYERTLDGKAKYRYLYGRTYQEAKNKKNEFLRNSQNTVNKPKANKQINITLNQVMKEYLNSRKDALKKSTFTTYVNLYEQHIQPSLGSCHLDSLTSEQLNSYLKQKLISGRINQCGGLSSKTVTDIRSLLLMGLNYARHKQYPCEDQYDIFCPPVLPPSNPNFILIRAAKTGTILIIFHESRSDRHITFVILWITNRRNLRITMGRY